MRNQIIYAILGVTLGFPAWGDYPAPAPQPSDDAALRWYKDGHQNRWHGYTRYYVGYSNGKEGQQSNVGRGDEGENAYLERLHRDAVSGLPTTDAIDTGSALQNTGE